MRFLSYFSWTSWSVQHSRPWSFSKTEALLAVWCHVKLCYCVTLSPWHSVGPLPLCRCCKRCSVHRQSLWIIGLRAVNVSPLNHSRAGAVSQGENASSPLKLRPSIYYVYVYKSLRRPRIPEACKNECEKKKKKKRDEEEQEVKRRRVRTYSKVNVCL